MYDGEAMSNKHVLNLFAKGGYSFIRFNYNRELTPGCWRNYRESTFANIELGLQL